jgi:hypothetical protein
MKINDADAIRLGSQEVSKLYLGSTLVWQPAPTGPAWGDNLIGNPGADTALTPWTNVYGTFTRDTSTSHSGIACFKHVSGAAGYGFYDGTYRSLPVGATFLAGFWAKGSGTTRLELRYASAAVITFPNVVLQPDWTYYSWSQINDSVYPLLFPMFVPVTHPTTMYIDDIELRNAA